MRPSRARIAEGPSRDIVDFDAFRAAEIAQHAGSKVFPPGPVQALFRGDQRLLHRLSSHYARRDRIAAYGRSFSGGNPATRMEAPGHWRTDNGSRSDRSGGVGDQR